MAEELGVKGSDSAAAREGTAIHEVAALMLLNPATPAVDFVGHVAENGVVLAEDGVDCADFYARTIEAKPCSEYAMKFVEQYLDLSDTYGIPEQGGTGDFVMIDGDTAHVDDLKSGHRTPYFAWVPPLGVEAPVEDTTGASVLMTLGDLEGINEQLAIYGLGALDQLDLSGEVEWIYLTIHQPRLGVIDSVKIPVATLREWQDQVLVPALQEAQKEDPPVRPGDAQCKWCPVAYPEMHCRPLTEYVVSQLPAEDGEGSGLTFDDLTEAELAIAEPAGLTPEEVDAIYSNLKLVEKWCKALRERQHSNCQDGTSLEYKLVAGKRGNKRYADEEEALTTLKGVRLKKEVYAVEKLKTPTQLLATPEVKGSVRYTRLIEGLVTQDKGKPTVAHVSDKREALDLGAEFEDLTDEEGDLA